VIARHSYHLSARRSRWSSRRRWKRARHEPPWRARDSGLIAPGTA
jgi:hypothetical protein